MLMTIVNRLCGPPSPLLRLRCIRVLVCFLIACLFLLGPFLPLQIVYLVLLRLVSSFEAVVPYEPYPLFLNQVLERMCELYQLDVYL